MTLTWKRRDPARVAVGYYAEGPVYRYVAFRDEARPDLWRLTILRLRDAVGVPGIRLADSIPVHVDYHDTYALCRKVAEAFDADPVLHRAISVAYRD